MSIGKELRQCVALELLLLVAAASSYGADTNPARVPGPDRPSTVVVSVPDAGFHWADAGIGAAATVAAALLGFGLVLALRRDRTTTAR